ncbi:class I SAM-dependent methyltransferase [Terrarubrum flagellatum]|uniref:class I SAM-dependent methyltransferase n=1 Tax=Terrirubrum flagellatum TaxID=2895980 RepID=UPI0031451A0A
MSGFSADWLALREPADHAARNRDILSEVAAHFAGADHLSIIDLGCGAGSNLRGAALALPASRQSWTLIDYDPTLLAVARDRLAAWADRAESQGEELLIEKAGKEIAVDFRRADLNADVDRVLGWRPDLVTAAALFDLVSADWIDRFVASLARHRLPLYTVLTYDGREEWTPPHALDAGIHRAFLEHQRRDKGFGPSAGPDAISRMASAFAASGYRVATGDSPWRLGAREASLAEELIAGIAQAAGETGFAPDGVAAWREARLASLAQSDSSPLVGHLDLWARPA